ncbi:MAG: hypothetical protein IKE85_00250 [Mogibacterium sp.]|nr:hypothetical protein [Mogibacterium sp.]
MRKRVFIILAAIAVFAFVLAGCSTSEFGLSSNEDSVTITAKNAEEDSVASTTFTVEENQAIQTVADFSSEGSVRIDIYQGVVEMDEDADEVADADEDKLLMSLMMNGTETLTQPLEPGEYTLVAEVEGKVTGTGTITLVAAN